MIEYAILQKMPNIMENQVKYANTVYYKWIHLRKKILS